MPEYDPNAAERPGKREVGDERKPAEYVRAIRSHLRSGRKKSAYTLVMEAEMAYPNEPLILSYYGYLQAAVNKKYRSGVEACRRALVLFKAPDPYTGSVVYPLLYLNLGRTYLGAGRKKEAIEALRKGAKHDRGNIELKKELQRLGIRKDPPLSFLARSNPLNKYLGKLLNSVRKGKGSKRPSGR